MSGIAYTKTASLVADFVSRGLVVLSPDDLGIDRDVHRRIYEREKTALQAGKYITASLIPDILQVLDAPGLVAACDELLGKNWAIVPFTHNTPFMSGSNDQHWHKDDNGPYNGRKQRHHQPVQLEILYYPQEVRPDMGPTATVPYSQYWTFNHEENHDNFAGADHLDFAYQLTGMERVPISGPRSKYNEEDVVKQCTDHDMRMRKAVTDLNWPLCEPFEAAPLAAGSVILHSHNLIHHGNHRRDAWQQWKDNPRFMWRFWLYRTTEPKPNPSRTSNSNANWLRHDYDPLTGIDMRGGNKDVYAVWDTHLEWLTNAGGRKSPARVGEVAAEQDAARLAEQILARDDAGEPARIGAAYRLARLRNSDFAAALLEEALHNERESVRRAASYGLVALGEAATPVLLRAADSAVKWIRKAAAFGLGDAASITQETALRLSRLLRDDSSVYVRSVAASALGCWGRRALADEQTAAFVPVVVANLIASLEVEVNRLSMDKVQGRSIKMVRPTDDCDVCEGIGIDYQQPRFEPVRSAVRENVLWSLVILCSHGARQLGESLEPVIDALQHVVTTDKNVFCVGFAMDALNRLVHLATEPNQKIASIDVLADELERTFARSPIHSLEPILRGGLNAPTVAKRYAVSDRMHLPIEKVAPQYAAET